MKLSKLYFQSKNYCQKYCQSKNFQCDSQKEGSKIPRKIFFVWWKPNFEKTIILYMTIPKYRLYCIASTLIKSSWVNLDSINPDLENMRVSPNGTVFNFFVFSFLKNTFFQFQTKIVTIWVFIKLKITWRNTIDPNSTLLFYNYAHDYHQQKNKYQE